MRLKGRGCPDTHGRSGIAQSNTHRGLRPPQKEDNMGLSREDRLEAALKEIAGMKIPYCDADDVAHSMREIAKDALADSQGGES